MNYDKIPQSLHQRGYFCTWRHDEQGSKKTKVPLNPVSGSGAQINRKKASVILTILLRLFHRMTAPTILKRQIVSSKVDLYGYLNSLNISQVEDSEQDLGVILDYIASVFFFSRQNPIIVDLFPIDIIDAIINGIDYFKEKLFFLISHSFLCVIESGPIRHRFIYSFN